MYVGERAIVNCPLIMYQSKFPTLGQERTLPYMNILFDITVLSCESPTH